MQACVGTKNNLGKDFKFQTKSKDDIHIYPLPFKMQVSVGTKNNLGKALSLCHGYSLTQLNNDE